MEDLHTDKTEEAGKKSKKNRTLTLKINRDVLIILIAIVLAVVTYFIGYHNGQESDKKGRAGSLSDMSRQNSESLSNRWTSVGTVTEISDSKIKVKDSRGDTKEAAITKDTIIVDRKGTKLATKDIKKDQRVIVSGTKDTKDKNKLTTTRIRIQQ